MAKPTTAKKSKPLSKSAVLQAVADAVGEEVARKHVKQIVETLVTLGHKELKKNGIFVLHGFAKFVVVKKPARPARKGINPFTKEPTTFAAKPASKAVKARATKAIKDAIASPGCQPPVAPSMHCRSRSAWPLCRAYSSIMWV